MKQYTLHIPRAVARQLQACRASIRQSIAERLRVIVAATTDGPAGRRPPASPRAVAQGPAHRFYVLEGYRVSYVVMAVTRRVVVLELQPTSG